MINIFKKIGAFKKYTDKKVNKGALAIINLLVISNIGISLYFIYNISLLSGIENIFRYSIMGLLIIIDIIFILSSINTLLKNKFKKYMVFIFIILISISIQSFLAFNINKVYSSINKMSKKELTYSTSLITMKDSKIKDINDLKNKKIGIISDKDNIEGYIVSQDIIKEYNLNKNNKLINYDEFMLMLKDLYNGEIDAIFVSSNYGIMFSSVEEYSDIKHDTKVIVSKDKKMVKPTDKDNIATSGKKLTEPFTILLMGVDSEKEGLDNNAAFNGDSLMLITFNPKTLNTTMLSIPRDTYVPIMCFKNHIENKITHAAWYGESCMEKTIENFTGINIDYYVKINFKGVVGLVNALGGVTVDVPVKFCEQNSDRLWGKKTICLKPGVQKLNGEQALAFARHRKTLERGDIDRGLNQQLVVKAMMEKLKDIRSLDQVYKILDTVSSNMDTNLSTNQILSLYEVGKDILLKASSGEEELISMQQLFLSGYGQMIYYENMHLNLWNYVYYKQSLKEIVTAMKVNLGLQDATMVKKFSFSINDTYEKKIIGEGTYKETPIVTIPNFGSYSKDYALSWGIKNDVKIHFDIIDSSNKLYKATYKDNQIIGQNISAGTKLSSINKTTGITLKIVNKETQSTKLDCTLDENEDNSSCLVPNMIGWSTVKLNNWINSLPVNVTIKKISVEITDPVLEANKIGLIKSQDVDAGTKLTSIDSITIEYYVASSEPSNDTENPDGNQTTE
jgi:polyisoprenyl-teichoic acid--peptidoglycan teichoic acid transferase